MGKLKRSFTFAIALGLLVLMLSDCSSSSGSGGSGNAKITVEAYDYYFSPKTLTLVAGQPAVITVRDVGKYNHNFSITEFNVNTDLTVGNSNDISFTPDKTGTFQLFCEYHKDSHGMIGTIVVKSASTY